MAVTSLIYGNALVFITDAQIDWTADTFKAILWTSSYTPNQDTDDYRNDITAEVANGNGYTSGGATITTPTRTYTGATNTLKLDGDDSAWAAPSSFTARGVSIAKIRGGASSADELVCYTDFGGDETVVSGSFTVQWAAAGIVTIVAS